jgi:molybdopterin synthase catalytic subunit
MISNIFNKDEADYNISKLQNAVKKNKRINECGAIFSFEGFVRGVDSGKVTRKMVLSTPDKEKSENELSDIVSDIKENTGVIDIAVVHFIGEFQVGDPLFLAVVAGAHRKETMEALNQVVERVKYELDFKKEEITDEGTNIIMSGG